MPTTHIVEVSETENITDDEVLSEEKLQEEEVDMEESETKSTEEVEFNTAEKEKRRKRHQKNKIDEREQITQRQGIEKEGDKDATRGVTIYERLLGRIQNTYVEIENEIKRNLVNTTDVITNRTIECASIVQDVYEILKDSFKNDIN